MTDAEYKRWAKKNGVIKCRPMRAKITMAACKKQQQKARKVANGNAQRDDPNGFGYGDAFRAYNACGWCKRANPPIKHRPADIHVDRMADMPHPEAE